MKTASHYSKWIGTTYTKNVNAKKDKRGKKSKEFQVKGKWKLTIYDQ